MACFAVNPNSRILGFKYPLLQIPGSFSQALSGASSPDIPLPLTALFGSQTPPIAWATVPTALHLHYYQLDWSLKYLLKDRGLTAHAVLKSAVICSLHLLATLSTLLAVGASSFWCVSSCLNSDFFSGEKSPPCEKSPQNRTNIGNLMRYYAYTKVGAIATLR